MVTGLLTAAPARERLDWLDAARGLGILLVVFAHCLRGLETAGIQPLTPLVETVDRVIYAFHMPLFFLLSGLMFEHVARRHAPAGFLRDRMLRLLWPLALWTWIFFAFRAAAGNAVNGGASWAEFPLNPLPPQLHFWFLWALFVISVVLYLMWRLWQRISGSRSDTTFWLGSFTLSCILALWVPVPEALGPWLVPAVLYAPCLIAGVLFARGDVQITSLVTLLLTLALFALLLWLAATLNSAPSNLSVALFAPVLLLLALRRGVAMGVPFPYLGLLGQASMAIFLAHTMFSAGVRIVLVMAGIADPVVHLVLGTLAGLAGPLALWAAARRYGLMRLAGF